MELSNKVLSKASISWTDVQKQLLTVIQTRGTSIHTSTSSTHQLPINKTFVKQCTDLLIKQIKNLSQTQVIEQLENFAQSCNLGVFKTPSEEDPTTVNAFLNTDDFFFEVSVNVSGRITEVKFSIFSEAAKSSPVLKDIFCSWNWDSLSKHIEGIKQNYILSHNDHPIGYIRAGDYFKDFIFRVFLVDMTSKNHIRANGFKAIECLEKDLSSLYQIQLKYLDKFFKASVPPTKPNVRGQSNQSKYLEKLVNQTPIGVFKKSELGESVRLYYYLSPLDLIQHHQVSNKNNEGFDITYKIISSLTTEELIKNDLGTYLSISLLSALESPNKNKPLDTYKLPDCSLLTLNQNDDERNWSEAFSPYFNNNFSFEKVPLFHKLSTTISNYGYKYKTSGGNFAGIEIPGTYAVKLNKPLVMCQSTLSQLHALIGVEKTTIENTSSKKPVPFFELLAKTSINNKILNDAYSVQLPDENQVYYITELDQPNCLGVLVDKILFTHPQDLLVILETLRKQLFFNELLLSCMKTMCTSAYSLNNNYNTTNLNYEQEYESNKQKNLRILEIGLLAPHVVSVIMQHPRLLCYTTIEIDVSRGNVETRFRDHNDLHNPNFISEIIRRCHSIPVTIRALLMKYKQNPTSTLKRQLNNDSNGNDSNGFHAPHPDNSNHYHNNNNNNHNNPNSSHFNQSNTGNNSHTYGKSHKSNNRTSQSEASSDSDTQEDTFKANNKATPVSLFGNDALNSYSTNRMTPSRRDSYRTNSSSSSCSSSGPTRTPNCSKSIFEFSNSISEQKRLEEQRLENSDSERKISSIKKSLVKPEIEAQSTCDQEVSETLKKAEQTSKDSVKVKKESVIKTEKSSGFQTPNLPVKKLKKALSGESSPSPVLSSNPNTPGQSANKKRKAPSNSESSLTPSSIASTSQTASHSVNITPTTTTIHPPSAKRKMIQSSTSAVDFKRHTSLIETDTAFTNKITSISSSSSVKKVKLKSSSSSVELTSTVKSSENTTKKHDSSGRSTPTQKKDSVLTAVINSNPSPSNKIKSGASKPSNNQNKKSSSSLSSSSPHSTKTLTPGSLKPKPMSEESLKMRTSKHDKDKSRAGASLTNKTNNLSATEIPLKQPSSSSSPLNTGTNTLGSNAITSLNVSTPSVFTTELSKNLSSTRTPSPLSTSAVSSLATPSPILSDEQSEHSESSSSTTSRYDPPAKSKIKLKSDPSKTMQLASAKPNTPPLSSSSTSLASFALGLGSSFKATSFKIPKGKKDTSDEDTPKQSAIAVTPAANNPQKPQLSSPNKISTDNSKSVKSVTNRNMPPPTALGGNKNNSSPKWQANYSGNMSPRYVNSCESGSGSSSAGHSPSGMSNKSGGKFESSTSKQQQQVGKSGSHRGASATRPATPVQSQTSSSSSNRQSTYNKNQPSSQTTQPKSSIMPLMSFTPPHPVTSQPTNTPISTTSSHTPSSPSQETPSSPPMYPNDPIDSIPQPKLIPIIPEIKKTIIPTKSASALQDSQQTHKPISTSPTPRPPDSPTSETLPVFVPKVIPLERNINSLDATKSIRNSSQETKKTTKSNSKLKSVDIASPDADTGNDNENLIINSPDQNSSEPMHFANMSTTHIPTTAPAHLFSTRQLISTNEALSNKNAQIKSPQNSSSVKVTSPSCQVAAKRSPTILEEDMLNEPLTG